MVSVHRSYDDIETAVDEVHALFEEWEDGRSAEAPSPPLDPFGLQVMKLAVHEWIANLIQHADFGARKPRLRLAVAPDGSRVRCVIEDNSRGFEFARQIAHQQFALDTAPQPPDRGRGLLLMIACTQNISYQPVPSPGGDGQSEPPWQRLEFWVAPQSISEVQQEFPAFDPVFEEDNEFSGEPWSPIPPAASAVPLSGPRFRSAPCPSSPPAADAEVGAPDA